MNPDFMLILVQSIQQYPYIWDTHYPQYNHRELTEKAWKDISDYCEQPVHVCKTKWKNVRTGFFRSLMKNRRFHLFDSMQFMLPVFLRNETFAKQFNLLNHSQAVNNESEIVKIEDSSSEPLNDDELEELENNSSDSKGNQRYFSEFSFLNNNSTKQETSTASLKRDSASASIILDDNDSSSSSAKKSKTTDNSATQITKEEQALMSFFKGIAPDVLSLSAQNQRFLKRKIVEMIDDLHSETSETTTNGSISSKKCQSLNSTNGITNNGT